jgi:hypothetical protein
MSLRRLADLKFMNATQDKTEEIDDLKINLTRAQLVENIGN